MVGIKAAMEHKTGMSGNRTMPVFFKHIVLIIALSFVSTLISCNSDKQEALRVGDSAPDFSITDLDGKKFTLSEYKGIPVVMRFFLTDCKFCRADTPMFGTYYTKHGSENLGMVYIDTLGLDKKTLEAFKQEFDIPFPIARDVGGKVASQYKVKALPQTIILNPEHKIIAAILGSSSEEEFQELMSPYLP